MDRVPRHRRGIGSPRALPIALAALLLNVDPLSGQVEVDGILEPLAQVCERETHRIVDACSGEATPVLSTWNDLAPFHCRHVAAAGSEVGLFCPAIDLRDIAGAAPACPIEVRHVLVSHVDARTALIHWDAVPCAESYDVVYGVLGVPASGACRAETDCGATQYCAKFIGDCGGVGQCRAKPPACTAVYDPVCGCDGATYSNACVANFLDMTVACAGVCPCPATCGDPGAPCSDAGPVLCRRNDLPEIDRPAGIGDGGLVPPIGQIYFTLIRAKGPGDIGVTTYGFAEPEHQERFFAGDCPR